MGNQNFVITYAHNTKYIGEIKDKKPHGKGKVIFSDGITVEGTFQDGKAVQGKVEVDGFKYEGKIEDGKFKGQGKLIDRQKIVYTGRFQDGLLQMGTINAPSSVQPSYNCTGTYQSQTIIAENASYINFTDNYEVAGYFKKGNLNGDGEFIDKSHQFKYTGEFAQGRRHGKGEESNKFFVMKGTFSHNLPHGICDVTFSNGDHYVGQMSDGMMHGQGKYTAADQTTYEGAFYYDSMWGPFTITFPQGHFLEMYSGQMHEGQFNGVGVLHYSNGVIFKGYFYNGCKNGPGVIVYGSQAYKCLYVMDELVGQIKLAV